MDLLNSISVLITAIAALLGSAASLLKATIEFRKGKGMKKATVKKYTGLAAVLFSLSAALFVGWTLGRQAEAAQREELAQEKAAGLPLNVQLTSAAWDAYNDSDFELSISKARECIDEFEGSADRQQQQLEEADAPAPPTNTFRETEKAETLARGPLNDVATSYYIVGRSAEKLGRLEEAKEAYRNASRYTYGRTWDPKGWFWSPAEKATDRLRRLEE
jgi:tetratricopeptide (TPR) repeat protein